MFKKIISNILLVVAIINHYYYSINLIRTYDSHISKYIRNILFFILITYLKHIL